VSHPNGAGGSRTARVGPWWRLPTGLRGRLNVMFILGGAVLVLVVAIASVAFVHLIDARHALLSEVDPASLSADQLLVAYVDQETGIRGYVLGRDTAFLQPTNEGVISQKAQERDLAQALTNRPALLHLVHAFEAQANVWQREYAQPAIRATAEGSNVYTSAISVAEGKHLFDGIRSSFAALNTSLTASRASAGNDLNSATVELVVALAVGMLLLIVAGFVVRRSLRIWVIDPLSVLALDARQVARGELSHEIIPVGPHEINQLGVDVEAMRRRIVEELHEVASARTDLNARNEDLARSNRDLEQFAYVASHDLQEPLRKVTSFVQLLEQRYRGELDERADQYIGFAVDGATRMQRLINDLLAFSRVGRSAEGFGEVQVSACVHTALENLEPVILSSHAEVSHGDLPVVFADASLITSLWQNLIGNSIKFHGAEAPRIDIEVAREGQEWFFGVTDNGIGIESRFSEKVFVIFQRLHGRDSYEGTGIGLALCRKIVEFHGGRMWLDTTPRIGTRICFTLPVPTPKDAP
jgi:signal transduction histidine kinase